ncbi:MAG: molybdopterin-dependent oxidoreductase [Hyphomicrobiales bacterium]
MDATAPKPVRTTCPYCGVGCGVLATRRPDGTVAITGDPAHPANYGRLCSKGSALAETLALDDRLMHPSIGGARAGWDEALDLVAAKFSEAVAEHGSDSVAFYVSGQILTEDYYVANKLMKGYIGSANIDTNSRLCMASSVAGHRRAFGTDTVPGTYRDIETADVVVLTGSNLAWCHPVLFQRLLAARKAHGTKIVVIDPRRTKTADAADIHLPLKPGSDVALYLGLLGHLMRNGRVDRHYVESFTTGMEAALAVAEPWTIDAVADATGLPQVALAEFFELFATTENVVTVYSQGVNQSSFGTDKVNAILNCHFLTGRIGRPGMGPFSVTGQPNAMGGREVGGLANMLAAHMDIENPTHREIVQEFWASPAMAERPGLKAVDLFRAVGEGRIKALWIMATNPVDSLPEADTVRAALEVCPFVVVSEVVTGTDTLAYADVVLPAAAWSEKDGTVTNSERFISRQKGFRIAPGEARADWDIIADVGRRMGFAGFEFDGVAAVYREYAALSAHRNAGTRDLDLGAHAGLADDDYDDLAPFQWPLPASGEGVDGDKRFFAAGGFFTPDRKGRFVPTPVRAPQSTVSEHRPLALNTGRIRDQWHTMTRTGASARLSAHYAEPFVEIHPDDAATYGISPAGLVEVESDFGRVVVRALVTDAQRQGSVFVPMHWTDQNASAGRVDAVVRAATDPVSGQPESKFSAVSVRPFKARWHGFVVSTDGLGLDGCDYFAVAPANAGLRAEIAGLADIADAEAFATEVLGAAGPDCEALSYFDRTQGAWRIARFRDGRLVAAMFVSAEPVAVSRSYAAGLLGKPISGADRLRVLAGRGGRDGADEGAIVCSCLSVGINRIRAAIKAGAKTVDAVGEATGAGTNCGSCRIEVQKLLEADAAAGSVEAAEPVLDAVEG